MENHDYWRLCNGVSIFQAIMLVLGYDPQNDTSNDIENRKRQTPPEGYGAVRTALVNAAKLGELEGNIIPFSDGYSGEVYENTVDIDQSIVSVSSLKKFLSDRGFKANFFFPEDDTSESYLDPQNPYYAPKLAAAVNAWKTITENPALLNGKTPKKAMEKWLRENARDYELTKDDGNPNETGIEEICKIANWKPEGGATKTPTLALVKDNPPTPRKSRKLKVLGAPEPEDFSDLEEIPF